MRKRLRRLSVYVDVMVWGERVEGMIREIDIIANSLGFAIQYVDFACKSLRSVGDGGAMEKTQRAAARGISFVRMH